MYGNSFGNSIDPGDDPRPPAGAGMLRNIAGGILMSIPPQR